MKVLAIVLGSVAVYVIGCFLNAGLYVKARQAKLLWPDIGRYDSSDKLEEVITLSMLWPIIFVPIGAVLLAYTRRMKYSFEEKAQRKEEEDKLLREEGVI
jgi:hypothetical protein